MANPHRLAAAVNAYLTRHLGEQYTAAQVAVYHHGKRVTSQSVGMSPRADDIHFGADGVNSARMPRWASLRNVYTLPIYFDLASLTKLFTTTVILQAVSAGKITLHTPIVEIIPEFGASGGRAVSDGGQNPHTRAIEPPNPAFAGHVIDPASITIFHLLTHTSGLAPWRQVYDDAPPPPSHPDSIPSQSNFTPAPPSSQPDTILPDAYPDPIPRSMRWARALKIICDSPFIAPPGYAVRYSDLGFMLLGEAATRLNAVGTPNGASATATTFTLQNVIDDLTTQLFPDSPSSIRYTPTHAQSNTPFHGKSNSPLHGDSNSPLHSGEGLGVRFTAPTEYDSTWRKRRVWGEVHDENACGVGGVAGHAGLFGTADALAQFGAQWCAADVPGMSPDLARDATRVHAETDGERRGLGWMVRSLGKSSAGTAFGANSYGHTGFVGNMLWIDPDQALVVCCLTNNVYLGRQKPGLFEFRVGLNDLIWEALCSS